MIPKIIFLIPYRNRPQQKHFFNVYIQHILEDYLAGYCKVFFVEQSSKYERFNRGAVKNIGFMVIREHYPNDYKNMTFVFNDVDTLPYKKNLLKYETVPGIIKHFYGKCFALGGIFSINGGDFEKIGGFPNYWTWGHEDVVIVKRAEKYLIRIDRSTFFELGSPNIVQLNDEKTRQVDISTAFVDEDSLNTYKIIMNLKYTFNENNNYSKLIYIDNFDLALEKRIFNYIIDLKKGEEHHIKEFGKVKQQYKQKYGDKKQYFINNISGAKEHLLNNNIDLSLFIKNETRVNIQQNASSLQRQEMIRRQELRNRQELIRRQQVNQQQKPIRREEPPNQNKPVHYYNSFRFIKKTR